MNFLYGKNSRKEIDYKHENGTEIWILIEYDDRVEEYHKIENGVHAVKFEIDEGIDESHETSRVNGIPSHSSSLILSNSKRVLKNFTRIEDGFKTHGVF